VLDSGNSESQSVAFLCSNEASSLSWGQRIFSVAPQFLPDLTSIAAGLASKSAFLPALRKDHGWRLLEITVRRSGTNAPERLPGLLQHASSRFAQAKCLAQLQSKAAV
jgi:hypothetical protein